jgi:hydrogenase maturation factor
VTPGPDPRHCITCSDEGEELTVLRVDAGRAMALCRDDGGAHSSVEIALVGDVAPGDTLLVHAGTALLCVRAAATGANA